MLNVEYSNWSYGHSDCNSYNHMQGIGCNGIFMYPSGLDHCTFIIEFILQQSVKCFESSRVLLPFAPEN